MIRSKNSADGFSTPHMSEVPMKSAGRLSARSRRSARAVWLPAMPTRKPSCRSFSRQGRASGYRSCSSKCSGKSACSRRSRLAARSKPGRKCWKDAGSVLGSRVALVVLAVAHTIRQGRTTPGATLGEQLREVGLEHAELVAPRVAEYPEVVAALLLVVPAGGAERFEAFDFSFNVVGFEVEVHPLLGDLHVVGALQQHPNLGVREPQAPVDVAARLRQRLVGGVERGRPELDGAVEVVAVDHEMAQAAAVMAHERSALMRSRTT